MRLNFATPVPFFWCKILISHGLFLTRVTGQLFFSMMLLNIHEFFALTASPPLEQLRQHCCVQVHGNSDKANKKLGHHYSSEVIIKYTSDTLSLMGGGEDISPIFADCAGFFLPYSCSKPLSFFDELLHDAALKNWHIVLV